MTETLECHFEGIESVIIEKLLAAKSSVKVAMAYFTNERLFKTLCDLSAGGIRIELIIQNDNNNYLSKRIDLYNLLRNSGRVFISLSNEEQILIHHKFCIIDESTLITGSYNWTVKASRNFENVLVIEKQAIIDEFLAEFEHLKSSHTFECEFDVSNLDFSFGFPELDQECSFKNGDLISIVGRSITGKTTIAYQVINEQALKNNIQVLYASAQRVGNFDLNLCSYLTKISKDSLKNSSLEPYEYKILHDYELLYHERNLNLYYLNSFDELLTDIRRDKITKNLSIVIIDDLDELDYSKEGKRVNVEEYTRKLKMLARELNIAIILTSKKVNEDGYRRSNDLEINRVEAFRNYSDLILLVDRPVLRSEYEDDDGLSLVGVTRIGVSVKGAPVKSFVAIRPYSIDVETDLGSKISIDPTNDDSEVPF